MPNIYRIPTLLSILLASLFASAVPPCPWPVDYTDPSGRTTKVSVQGNADFHYFTAADGSLLTADEEGYLIPLSSSELNMRRAAAPQRAVGLHNYYVAHTGTPPVLVMLVQFADVKFSMADPRAYFQDQLTQPGFNQHNAPGSVRDYYLEQSGGQFSPAFEVYGPVTLGNRSGYASNSNGYKMVFEAASALDSQIDFSRFDLNGDGMVDNVCIIYAGGGANGGVSNAPWPHASTCPTTIFNRKVCDGKTLAHYLVTSELQAYINEPALGTFIHEFGHILGLPDHYNTKGLNDYTPGYWDVMDIGCYNNGGRTPCGFSLHERWAMGWLTPYELTGAADVILRPITQVPHGYIIQTGRSGDYYLLENRKKEGFDAALPGEGMLIWHIDGSNASMFGTGDNVPNNDSSHLRVDLVEADGSVGASNNGGDCWPGSSGKTAFTSTSSPAMVRWNASTGSATTPVDKPLTEIARNSSGLVSFKFCGGNPSNVIDPLGALTFRVEAEPAQGGIVVIANNGQTQYSSPDGNSQSIELRATPAQDYIFTGWYFKGALFASTETIYVASQAARAGTYTARFQYVDPNPDPNAPSGTTRDTYYLTSIVASGQDVAQEPYTASTHPGNFYNTLGAQHAVTLNAGTSMHLTATACTEGSGVYNMTYSVAYIWRETAPDQWQLIETVGRKSMDNSLFVKTLNTDITFPLSDAGQNRRIRILYAYSYLSNADALTPTSKNINHGICYDIPVIVREAPQTPKYTIRIQQPEHGLISLSTSTGATVADGSQLEEGTKVNVTVTPDEGWLLDHVILDLQRLDSESFAVTGPHTVTAVMRQNIPDDNPLPWPQGSIIDGYYLSGIEASGYGVEHAAYAATEHPGSFYVPLPEQHTVQGYYDSPIGFYFYPASNVIGKSVVYIWYETEADTWQLIATYGGPNQNRWSLFNPLYEAVSIPSPESDPLATPTTNTRLRILYANSDLEGVKNLTPTSTDINHGICYDIPMFLRKMPTSVSTLSAPLPDMPIFTPSGLRVTAPLTPGLYIQGGRKILIRP